MTAHTLAHNRRVGRSRWTTLCVSAHQARKGACALTFAMRGCKFVVPIVRAWRSFASVLNRAPGRHNLKCGGALANSLSHSCLSVRSAFRQGGRYALIARPKRAWMGIFCPEGGNQQRLEEARPKSALSFFWTFRHELFVLVVRLAPSGSSWIPPLGAFPMTPSAMRSAD